jgi:hypothetical protein
LKAHELTKYAIYLERKLKERKIDDRAKYISKDLTSKLTDRTKTSVEIFHVSASEYMQWIARDKIRFSDQPTLSPEKTGIPAIRQLLYSLPAQKNLDDARKHIYSTLPAFIEKVNRVVVDSDRDVGFKNLADEFDRFRQKDIALLLPECKKAFHDITQNCLEKVCKNDAIYRDALNVLIEVCF